MSTYTGTIAQIEEQSFVKRDITTSDLEKLLNALGPGPVYTVMDTDGGDTGAINATNVTTPNTLVIVNDQADTAVRIDGIAKTSAGAVPVAQSDMTFISNTTSQPIEVVPAYGSKSAAIELSGAATVSGGTTHTFVVDGSNDTSAVNLTASSADGSYSWLIGGSGNDTLTGSSSSTGKAVLGDPDGKGSGPTTMNGGAGAVTMYGGGHTSMVAGDHVGSFLGGSTMDGGGQSLYDFTVGAVDTMVAGSGGYNTLSVAHGNGSILDDRAGNGTDYVFAGGNDTVYGSANGTSINLSGGNSLVQSAGADSISVGPGPYSDSIFASTAGVDTVSIAGHSASELNTLVQQQENISGDHSATASVTLNFTNASGAETGQSVTLHNVGFIKFQ